MKGGFVELPNTELTATFNGGLLRVATEDEKNRYTMYISIYIIWSQTVGDDSLDLLH